MKPTKDKEQQGKALTANPSPIGAQQNPVSSPRRKQDNPIEEELAARENFLKEKAAKDKGGKGKG